MTRWVLHVDLDQFIAAVEVLRHPELRGKPLVVGGDGDPSKRGVVSTASYEAREFGVHSGQPLRTAKKRCPDCIFLPVDAPAYLAVSAEVMQVLRDTGAPVEVLGWDEAFVGIEAGRPRVLRPRAGRGGQGGDPARLLGRDRPEQAPGQDRDRLRQARRGLPADLRYLVRAPRRPAAGRDLGDRRQDGRKLAGLAIHTVRELADADPDRLAAEFGPMTGPWLVLLGQGRGDAEVDPTPYVARSHGREVTFQKNLEDWAEVRAEVARLARKVAAEVMERTVVRAVVKVRYAPFVTVTHGVPFPAPGDALFDVRVVDASAIDQPALEASVARPVGPLEASAFEGPPFDASAFETAALAALAQFEPGRPVRLLGVRAEFADEPA